MSEPIKIDPQNPFDDAAPKIVHFEKNESHYEYCRMQMHEIEREHRRTFIADLAIGIFVSFLSIFGIYIKGFSLLSMQFVGVENMTMMSSRIGAGIFQIVISMFIIILGYFAWANFHSLNIILITWYGLISLTGIFGGDYLSAIVGAVGFCFYFFAIQAMRREGALSQMEGYPEFHEKFDINKSDYVVQTLLAHRGERRERPSFFTGKTSLRKKKKKIYDEEDAMRAEAATDALAAELSRQIAASKDVQAAEKVVKEVELLTKEQLAPSRPEVTEMDDIASESN